MLAGKGARNGRALQTHLTQQGEQLSVLKAIADTGQAA